MLDMRVRSLALGFAVGAGIGAGGAYAYLRKLQPAASPLGPNGALVSEEVQPTDSASVFRYHPALKYGMPQTRLLRMYAGYVASFDAATRNPAWVLEYVDRETLRGEGSREQSVFWEDPGIEPRFRNKLDDFKDSGYDRGHMAPAANHRSSQKAMNDTFSLSNISPQVGPGFNRNYWARFEKFVKDTAKVADGVYIVTGPLWLPQPDGLGGGKWEMRHPMIGQPPQLVSVPTHYFKVVLADNTSGRHGAHQAAVGAFVMPNAPIDAATPVTAFAVPLDALESVAGTKFFPGFLNDRRRAALDAAALSWQAEGRAALRALDRVSLDKDQAVMLSQPAPPGALIRSNSKRQQAAAAAVPAPPPAAQQQQSSILDRIKTVGGDGAVHLCDIKACQLPQPGWWENNGTGPGGPQRSKSSGGLQRQGSGGRGRPRTAQEAAVVSEAAAPPPAAAEAQAGPAPSEALPPTPKL